MGQELEVQHKRSHIVALIANTTVLHNRSFVAYDNLT